MAVNRTYKPMLDEFGLTYPQYLVLSTLWEQDGLAVSVIADRLSLEPSTYHATSETHGSRQGFFTRKRNPKDERQVIVSLTIKGRSLNEKTACLTLTLFWNESRPDAEEKRNRPSTARFGSSPRDGSESARSSRPLCDPLRTCADRHSPPHSNTVSAPSLSKVKFTDRSPAGRVRWRVPRGTVRNSPGLSTT